MRRLNAMRWAPYAVRTAALGMLLATAGVLVAQAPAHACKCVNTTTAEDAAAADAVFSGTVRETHKPEPDESGRIKGLVTYVVDVDRVYKEEGTVVTDTVQVFSQQASASCGLGNLPPGTEYLFFAQARDAGFRASSCGGSRPATDGVGLRRRGGARPRQADGARRGEARAGPHRGRDRRPAAP